MSSNIYKEALAEAKQLREIAEKNAKNAIVEAVTPKIREFIDNQLMGVDESDSGEIDDIISESLGINLDNSTDVALDKGAMSTLAKMMGATSTNNNMLSALAESINSLDSDQADLVFSAAKKLNTVDDNLNSSEINRYMSELQENSKMASKEKVYEVDLGLLKEEVSRGKRMSNSKNSLRKNRQVSTSDGDTTLREMLHDLGILAEDKLEIDLGDDVELPDDIMITARLLDEEEADEDDLDVEEVMDVDDEGVEAAEEFEMSLDEVFEVSPKVLKTELRRIKRLVNEAKSLADAKGGINPMEDSWGGKGHANAGLKNVFGGKGSGKGNAFGGGSEKGDVYKVKLNSLKETLRKEHRKNRALVSRLEEYRSAVETLREQLTDINLFNAKLLYVNKLFQDKSVSPTRRRAMMESIDSAKSLREVKLIYKTLTSSQQRDKRRLNESTKRALGSSSRLVGRSSASNASSEVDRWAVLAGIKNK